MPLQSGQVVRNRYQIHDQLGQGGMGAVYVARDMALEQRVAVKEMRPASDLSGTVLDGLRQQFQREARVLAGLTHPNLPRVIDYFIENDNEYLVMDYIEGQALNDVLKTQGRPGLPEAQVLDWARQLLDALEYIHGKNVLHRDIKPANVRLTPDGRAFLVDFGLVKLYDPSSPQTVMVLRGAGTPQYAPPEQIDSSYGHTDARSDIFALGATLYYLLTGKLPPSITERLIKESTIPPIRSQSPNVSPATEAAIFKAIQMRPNDRFQTAAEMRAAMAQASATMVYSQPPARSVMPPTYVPPSQSAAPSHKFAPKQASGRQPVTPVGPPSQQASRPPAQYSTPPPQSVYPAPAPKRSGPPTLVWMGGCGCLAVVVACLLFLAWGAWLDANLTPTPPGVPTPASGQALYLDDFSNPDSGWDVYDEENAAVGYEGDKYFIAIKRNNWLAWANAEPALDLENVIIEVEAVLEQGPADDKAEFGVICRYQDSKNYNYFSVRVDGYAAIIRMNEGDQVVISSADKKYQSAAAIKSGQAANHIRASCIGDKLELYINGELAAQAQDDAPLPSGDVGLIAGAYDEANVRFTFDNMLVSVP